MLEVSLLARLQHPFIIGYYDHFHDGDELCMVMELAGGGDLDGELRKARKAKEPIWGCGCCKSFGRLAPRSTTRTAAACFTAT